jgi:hypothetical protein
MAVTSRNELIEYCLRRLGHPVMEINVDVDQIEDRIDDAFDYYSDYHYDATEHNFYAHQITQSDLDNGYIDLPDEMIFVRKVMQFGFGSAAKLRPMGDTLASWDFTVNNPFNTSGVTSGAVAYTTNDQIGMQSSLTDFFISMQGLENMQQTLGVNLDIPIRFNRHTNRVYFDVDMDLKLDVGQYIVMEGWVVLDPEVHTSVYNDRWIKRYATALLKQQWGMNLSKYNGIQLPGGVTLDGQTIYNEAKEELTQLEEEMQEKYELPVDFIMG